MAGGHGYLYSTLAGKQFKKSSNFPRILLIFLATQHLEQLTIISATHICAKKLHCLLNPTYIPDLQTVIHLCRTNVKVSFNFVLVFNLVQNIFCPIHPSMFFKLKKCFRSE
jgi:hypothetical protein